MTRRDKIFNQVEALLQISGALKEEFNTFRGAVQFFQHKNKPELFVFQIREAHIADVGKMLMQISYLVKLDYALLDGMTMKEKLNAPKDGYPPGQQYQNALKHVFLNIRLDPWLQHYIFSRIPTGSSPFQDVVRLPHVLENVRTAVPKTLLTVGEIEPPQAASR
ncbi:MAG: hypothetical protein DRP83_00785 [Planctomycetota bacterium]|nr:MAG: hypothetical protein DRP83_00785 [Planctomycetota bacterium]